MTIIKLILQPFSHDFMIRCFKKSAAAMSRARTMIPTAEKGGHAGMESMAGEDGDERFALLFAAATMSATVWNLNPGKAESASGSR